MNFLIIGIWYLIGFYGFLFFSYKAHGLLRIKDFLIAATIGGCYGLFILLIGVLANDWGNWLNKKIF